MGTQNKADILNKLSDIVKKAKKLGADEVEVYQSNDHALSAEVRMGKTTDVTRENSEDLYISVLVGKKSASVSIKDLSKDSINEAIHNAINAAKLSPDNPYAGLAGASDIETTPPQLDIYDPTEMDVEALKALALEAENAGLNHDKRIVNSDGSSASQNFSSVFMAASNGFAGTYDKSYTSVGLSLIAKGSAGQEQDYDYHSAVYTGDLGDPKTIGVQAAKNTLRGLDPSKMSSGRKPVVFDPRIGNSLLSHFLQAASGRGIAQNQSMLAGQLNNAVFGSDITIINDPFLKRGLGSRPFDGEQMPVRKTIIVDKGTLKAYLVDLESARQLGVQKTDHASSQGNIFIENGAQSVTDLFQDIKEGLYVTGLMGHGYDTVSGTYSRSASGLLIKDGQLTEQAISGVTISGTLQDMFANMIPANDLDKRKASRSVPTLRVNGMSIAGA